MEKLSVLVQDKNIKKKTDALLCEILAVRNEFSDILHSIKDFPERFDSCKPENIPTLSSDYNHAVASPANEQQKRAFKFKRRIVALATASLIQIGGKELNQKQIACADVMSEINKSYEEVVALYTKILSISKKLSPKAKALWATYMEHALIGDQ